MKLFKMFKRGQKGFTLVELMVVMAIMAVLATIVVPAVTGTKGTSESTQLSGDANAVQSAAAKYNNDSTVVKTWPEASISSIYSAESSVSGFPADSSSGNYTAVSWSANTTIRNSVGALVPVKFVPDFVPKTPTSDTAISGGKHVYVWVFKAGAATDAPTRTVEIYKLNDAGNAYTRVN